ncbi:uncharacterized protein LOC107320010 isoform X2 [Coturnix japonica]|uniref:uncharacterized protein LOC107320010 isoform X2 n=1 Tax=Coturnix japonica TaxID=93934 RepID=UPI000777A698|nr:uncharacterized protein LOC107320010 isoform X2 [Coturnix japonica]
MGMSQQAGHCKKPVSPMNTRAALEVVRNIAWTIVLLTSTAVTGASGINRLSVYLGDNAVMTCPNVINITMVTWKISPKTGGQCSLSYLNGHKTERTNCSDRINWRSRPEWDQALEIQQVEMADEGNYTCEVVNADGGFHHHYHLTVLERRGTHESQSISHVRSHPGLLLTQHLSTDERNSLYASVSNVRCHSQSQCQSIQADEANIHEAASVTVQKDNMQGRSHLTFVSFLFPSKATMDTITHANTQLVNNSCCIKESHSVLSTWYPTLVFKYPVLLAQINQKKVSCILTIAAFPRWLCRTEGEFEQLYYFHQKNIVFHYKNDLSPQATTTATKRTENI